MALAITYLDAAYWSGGATSPTLASVTLNTGDLLIALCLQDQPFDNQAVTSATWGANGLSQAIEKLGDTGGHSSSSIVFISSRISSRAPGPYSRSTTGARLRK